MLAKIAVADYMSEHVATVTPETDVAIAFKIMLENRINSIPVVDNHEKLVGIFSEKEV